MRDSLSILDKIVSFTNGAVTYQNTLEHLNILDDDYYFKLLEAMQAQDLPAAMLLFDEINRKGFEGDLVLNGFAEFIRNLLVCKDPKSASLLEVVEGMQAKYTITAEKAGISFLVSALNILNESEINYKMARNKRLHVELTLIKLNFLQQAIELSAENGQLVKKKRIDGPIAFRLKQVPSIQIATQTNSTDTESKLYIDAPKPATIVTPTAKPIATVVPKVEPIKPKTAIQLGGTKKGLLDSLREKYGDQYTIEEVKEAEVLNIEKLKVLWDKYALTLEEQKKHSSYGTFKIARLTIDTDILFTVTVTSVTSQKFVEQERMYVLEIIQNGFNNRSIGFQIIIDAGEQEEVPVHLRLNSRQKFERIAEQFPLVRELKDRLKMDIDY
jgi:DNA polymerase-3 subunit gamma/tau